MSVSSKTLFVRNLPYSTSDSQLEEVFSRHGQLKACFTVKEKGSHDQCRGFGYVTYESREAAEKALSLVKTVGSRPVQIVFAKQREPRKKTKEGKKNRLKVRDGEDENEGGDDTINRDRVGGVAINSDGNGAVESDADMNDEDDSVKESESSSSEEEDYETITERSSGVGGVGDTKGGARAKHKRKAERGDARFHTGRVVVLTGLPEMMAEKKLRKECEQIGKVESIEYPVSGREIPSAYITYSTHKEARVAVGQLSGRSFGDLDAKVNAQLLSREGKGVSKKSLKKSRLIVRNLSFKCSEDDLRQVFQKYGPILEIHIPRKPNGYMLGYAFVQFGSYFSAKAALNGVNMIEIKGRPVAVDWLVPKDQYEQSLKREEEEGERPSEEEDTENKAEEVDDESDAESHDSGMESHDHDAESCDSDAESHDSAAESGDGTAVDTKGDDLKRDVNEGKTLFIRNLPLNVDNKELKQLFYEFGRVRYCRVMYNQDTGLCTGSAFLQFEGVSSAESCLKACSSPEQGIRYHGQRLEVTLALSREEVERVCQERGAEGRKTRGEDKRNLYLAKEGAILPGSEAAAELSKTDMARRIKVYSQKKSKLVNPYFFVSKTRLSVHNLPVNVDEQRLKRVFLKAAADSDEARITQVKILRSSERVNSKGIGRSLGYGFVEFSSHDAALTALRATNNNPDIFGEKRRLIVEFAVEDSRALKLRERRKLRQQVKPTSSSNGQARKADVEDRDEGSEKPLSKRQKWRLKCKAKRLRRRERKKTLNPELAGAEGDKVKLSNADSAVSFELCPAREDNTAAPVVRRNHTQPRKLAGKVESRKAKVDRSDECPREKSSRKRKRNGVESSREEEEFAKMVDRYRKKLQLMPI